MRRAKAGDYWRRLYQRAFDKSCSEFEYNCANTVGQLKLTCNGALTVVCGGNGVGKSTLLKLAMHAIDPLAVRRSELVHHEGAIVSAKVKINGALSSVEQRIDSSLPASQQSEIVRIIDPSAAALRLKTIINDQENFLDLIEPLQAHEFTPQELEEVSFLVGKTYSVVSAFEIDDIPLVEPFPYFQVTSEGVTYGFETMGAGEGALFFLCWYLFRVVRDSFLLIEEPENHVSQRSQSAAMDILAKACVERGIWCVVTTHSAEIVSCVPRSHVRLAYRKSKATKIIDEPNDGLLESAIGLRIQRDCLVVCEDRLARVIISSIVSQCMPAIRSRMSICDAGSNSDIQKLLESFPTCPGAPRLVGVYDGDQRSSATSRKHPHAFLPGLIAPEIAFRNCSGGNAVALAEILGLNADLIEVQLSTIVGTNHHDWLEELVRGIAVSYESLVSALVSIWLQDEHIKTEAVELVRILGGLEEETADG